MGVGERLLTELFKRLREQEIFRVVLEVRQSNAPAIRLYEKLGFESAGTRRDFYERPREDACVMVYQ
jgi:ribosomal-protein-alanine N-acetyltransferase